MSYSNDLNRLCGIITGTKFPSFPGGANDVKVGDQLPNHAVLALAHKLLDEGLVFVDKKHPNEVHAHWICTYNRNLGETEVKCSHCQLTRDIKGCYVTTQGESCYHEDWYCPDCGATMDERV